MVYRNVKPSSGYLIGAIIFFVASFFLIAVRCDGAPVFHDVIIFYNGSGDDDTIGVCDKIEFRAAADSMLLKDTSTFNLNPLIYTDINPPRWNQTDSVILSHIFKTETRYFIGARAFDDAVDSSGASRPNGSIISNTPMIFIPKATKPRAPVIIRLGW